MYARTQQAPSDRNNEKRLWKPISGLHPRLLLTERPAWGVCERRNHQQQQQLQHQRSVIRGNTPDQIEGIPSLAGSLISTSCDIVNNTVGARCPGGTCIIATEKVSIIAGGTYAADGAACADAGCSDQTLSGACCLDGGACVTTTESDCTTAGGTYAGDGVACVDAECATFCAADINRDGVVDGKDLGAVLAAWGLPCEG